MVTGCQGQIGVPLVHALCKELGNENVVATDISVNKDDFPCDTLQLDTADERMFKAIAIDREVNYIVHLAGIMSALGEPGQTR